MFLTLCDAARHYEIPVEAIERGVATGVIPHQTKSNDVFVDVEHIADEACECLDWDSEKRDEFVHSYFQWIFKPWFISLLSVLDITFINHHAEYFVYGISDGSFLKIGVSNNVDIRLPQLQNGNPHRLTVLFLIPCFEKRAALDVEKRLHRLYQEYRANGEWFEVIDKIDAQEWAEFFSKKPPIANQQQAARHGA